MKTIYENIIEQVENGASCRVDFRQRSVHINGKQFDIVPDNLGIKECKDLDEFLDEVEDLYDQYKYSAPSFKSSKQERKSKFKALTAQELVRELGHNALSSPTNRLLAKAKLELFILLSLFNGNLNIDELFAKDWFYQGSDKSLIIKKDWF